MFAPPNDAFDDLFDELRINFDQLYLTALEQILVYHVVPGRLNSGTLQGVVDGEGDDTISTVAGQTIRVIESQKSESGLALVDRQSDISLIEATDIEASNGVIHVVDRVLVPLFNTVVEWVAALPFSNLLTLLLVEDLVGTLQGDGPFTVFAPNDEAFERLMVCYIFNFCTSFVTLSDVH